MREDRKRVLLTEGRDWLVVVDKEVVVCCLGGRVRPVDRLEWKGEAHHSGDEPSSTGGGVNALGPLTLWLLREAPSEHPRRIPGS